MEGFRKIFSPQRYIDKFMFIDCLALAKPRDNALGTVHPSVSPPMCPSYPGCIVWPLTSQFEAIASPRYLSETVSIICMGVFVDNITDMGDRHLTGLGEERSADFNFYGFLRMYWFFSYLKNGFLRIFLHGIYQTGLTWKDQSMSHKVGVI